MFTQCRGCGEIFVIQAEHLVHAHGKVRCNVCGTVFDALQTLSQSAPIEDEDLILHDCENAPPLLTKIHSANIEQEPQAQVQIDTQTQIETTAVEPKQVKPSVSQMAAVEQPSDTVENPAPLFSEQKKIDKKPARQAIWGWLSMAMLLLMAWQAMAAVRSGQLKLPKQPWAVSVCEWLECVQDKQYDLSTISLASSSIRLHPGRDNALIIAASLINADETRQQEFPILEIRMSDLDGKVVAMRRLQPREYLTTEVLQGGFIANTLIPVNLEIEKPSVNAPAFEIGFAQ